MVLLQVQALLKFVGSGWKELCSIKYTSEGKTCQNHILCAHIINQEVFFEWRMAAISHEVMGIVKCSIGGFAK